MLKGGNSYKLFFWVYFAVAAVLAICTVLFFEETMYFRKVRASTSGSNTNVGDADVTKSETNIGSSEGFEVGKGSTESESIPARKTWKQQLKIFTIVDKDINMLMMAVRLPPQPLKSERLLTQTFPDPLLHLLRGAPCILGL